MFYTSEALEVLFELFALSEALALSKGLWTVLVGTVTLDELNKSTVALEPAGCAAGAAGGAAGSVYLI